MQRTTLIDRWAAARGLKLSRASSEGRVTLTIDGEYRVHLSEAPNRKIALESCICFLPADRRECEQLVEKAMQLSAGRMRDDGAILAIDELEANLLLQAEVSADSDERGLSDVIGSFVNSLAFWRKVAV